MRGRPNMSKVRTLDSRPINRESGYIYVEAELWSGGYRWYKIKGRNVGYWLYVLTDYISDVGLATDITGRTE
jgi:hypothetical protein